jgi:hypothetical protein
MYAIFFGFESLAPNIVTITYGSDVTGFDAVRVGRGMPRAPFPFCGCGGTPHGRGSFAERAVSGGRLSGRGKGVAKQAGVATGGPLFTICTKRGCWYLVAPEPFGDGVRDLEECSRRVSEGSAARTYCCSGRTWTPLALPVRGERERGGRKAGWPGFPHSGKERARTEGESGKAGVPAMGGNGPGRKGRRRDGRGSLAMGRNGPGRKRAGCQQGRKRSRSRRLVREMDWKRSENRNRNRNELCRLCAVLLLPRPRHGGTARGRRLAAGAVGELGSARSPGIVGRKKHGFRGGFGGCG